VVDNGGRSGARHGDQRLGADPALGGDGPHRSAPPLRLQAHALQPSPRCQNRQRRASIQTLIYTLIITQFYS
jgi:hypothetical protein